MGIMDALEGAMRGVMQGTARAVFPSRLQEQEILDTLRRVMDDNVTVEVGRQIVPFHYIVRINQHDYQGLVSHPPSVEELQRVRQRLGLSENLVKLDQLVKLETRVQFEMKAIATSQGYLLTNALRVTFTPDEDAPRGRVEARVAPLGAAVPQPAGNLTPDATHTLLASPAAPLPAQPMPAAGAGSATIPPAWLTLLKPSRGEPIRLDRPVITIGRHDSNDIVVNERRVSRFHAEIRYDGGVFTLHDQASRNHVYINGVRVTRLAPLKDRDIIMIGGYEFVFQRR
jgi:hypothetical protein